MSHEFGAVQGFTCTRCGGVVCEDCGQCHECAMDCEEGEKEEEEDEE